MNARNKEECDKISFSPQIYIYLPQLDDSEQHLGKLIFTFTLVLKQQGDRFIGWFHGSVGNKQNVMSRVRRE
jgi:hypothetical protein